MRMLLGLFAAAAARCFCCNSLFFSWTIRLCSPPFATGGLPPPIPICADELYEEKPLIVLLALPARVEEEEEVLPPTTLLALPDEREPVVVAAGF